jgi:hypothetical protein
LAKSNSLASYVLAIFPSSLYSVTTPEKLPSTRVAFTSSLPFSSYPLNSPLGTPFFKE